MWMGWAPRFALASRAGRRGLGLAVGAALALVAAAGAAETAAWVSIIQAGDPVSGFPCCNWPAGEPPAKVLDGDVNSKYLHFGKLNTGICVTPSAGAGLVVRALALTTANDAPERDPASFTLEGSLDSNTWTVITAAYPVPPVGDRFKTRTFGFFNNASYPFYRITFPTVANPGAANSMQVAEVKLYGYEPGTLVDVTMPGDAITGLPNEAGAWPGGEDPAKVIDDNPGSKFLNFRKTESGFIVVPGGATNAALTGIGFTTANDAPERDPASVSLYGSDDGAAWTAIVENLPVALPSTRGTAADFFFENYRGFRQFKVLFPSLRDAGGANSMQVAEVRLLARLANSGPPQFLTAPASATIPAGQSARFWVVMDGTAPYAYQWLSNSAPIAGATQDTYTTPPARMTMDQAVYSVAVSNSFGVTNSAGAVLTVLDLPVVLGVFSLPSSNEVRVWFSKNLDAGAGLNPALYSINNAVTVVAARFGSTASNVILTTSGLADGRAYQLSVRDVFEEGNPAHVQAPNPAHAPFVQRQIGQLETAFQSLPAGSVLYGNAVLEGGVLKLTSDQGGQSGVALFGDLGYNGAPLGQMTVRFQAVAGHDSGNAPADGFAFAFGPDLPDGGWNAPEEGVGSGLSVAFDFWDNGSSEAPAIDVNVNGARKFHFPLPLASVATWPAWADAVVQLNSDGTLNLVYGGFSQSNLATGYIPVAGRFGFGGRTGGATANQWVRQLSITTGPNQGAPVIAAEPEGQGAWEKSPATFSVAAEGAPPFAYQWYSNGVEISGAAGRQYTTPPVTPAMAGTAYSVRVDNGLGMVSSQEARLDVYPLTLAVEPADVRMVEGQRAQFAARTGALPPGGSAAFQWQSADGSGGFTNIGGATGQDLITPRLWPCGPQPVEYRVVVSAVGAQNWITSRVAMVTLDADQDAPRIVSAGTLDGTMVVVRFSEPVDPATAAEGINYDVDGNSPAQAMMRTNTVNGVARVFDDQVVLLLDPSTPAGPGFQLTVRDVRDLACTANQMGAETVTGQFETFLTSDIGIAPAAGIEPGQTLALGGGALDVTGGGPDIWGAADAFHFAFRPVTGDFDVSARIESLDAADPWTKAGFMARASTNAASRNVAILATPASGAGSWIFQSRDWDGANTWGSYRDSTPPAPAAPLGYPQAWMRLQRRGSVFNAYVSTNGTNWLLYHSHDTAAAGGGAYPGTVLVGLAVTAHSGDPARRAAMACRDVRFPVVPVILTQPAPQEQTAGIHGAALWSVAASAPAAGGPLAYQWCKDGLPLPGAQTAMLVLPNLAVADAGVYTVWAGNDGGSAVSAPVVLTVTNQAPALAAVELSRTVCDFEMASAELLALAGAADPERDPVLFRGVSGIAPQIRAFNFDTGIPAEVVLYGAAAGDQAGGTAGSGCVKITDAVGSVAGSMLVADLVDGKAVSGFRAAFKLRVADGSPDPADGFSFCFASDLPDEGWGEEGAGSGLTVSFDNYNNGLGGVPSSTNEGPAIDVKWGGTAESNLVGHVLIPKIQTARWLAVTIELSASGLLDVTLDGSNVFSRLPVPYAPVRGGRFGLGARTGGSFEAHSVDDLALTVLTAQTASGAWVTADEASGVVRYQAASGACGPDQFFFAATDGQANGWVVSQASIVHPPLARDDQMSALSGAASTVPLAKLLANDFFPDGLPQWTHTQPAHGSVTESGGVVTYLSEPDYIGKDAWTYALDDGRGGLSTGTVAVTVAGPSPLQGARALESAVKNGQFWAKFSGFPNRQYLIQTTTNAVQGPWTTLKTVTASPVGVFEAVDQTRSLQEPQRYYRAVVQ